MALLFYVIKLNKGQFSKLTCCVCHVTFLHETSVKTKVLFQKDMLKNFCGVVSYWWNMEKYYLLRKSCHKTWNIMSSL